MRGRGRAEGKRGIVEESGRVDGPDFKLVEELLFPIAKNFM